jgi:type I restriction enzyme S subunit
MNSVHRLDEVCEIVMGQAPNGEAYNTDGNGWPLIAGAGDFGETAPQPSKFTTEASKVSRIGDIVIGIRATIGEKVLADGEYCLGRGVAGLRPLKTLDSRFLWHWLTFAAPRLARKARGATFKQVTKENIGDLQISVPALAEQRRIAEVLDRAEALRAQRRAALGQLDILTQSIFLDIFGDPATNPKGLQKDSLGDHLLFVTSGSRGWAEFYAPSGSRFIRSLDVQMNHIGSDDLAFVVPPDNAEARRTRVMVGDVLLTITGSRIGRVAPVPQDLSGAYISQHVAILRADPKHIEPIFLSFFLSFGAGGQRQIAKAQYGQTKPGLNFEQIRRFQIPVPPLPLQHDFARCVAGVEKLRGAHRGSLAEFDAFFAAVQFRAFRGEL